MITLAQADFGALKAEFLKSMLIFSVGTVIVMCMICGAVLAWLQYRLDKKSKEEEAKRSQEPQQISPQPFQIEFAKKFTEKHEFEEQKKHCTKRHGELFNAVDNLEKASGKELSALARQVASLQIETKLQSDQLKKLDTMEKELRDMPGKIVVDILNAQKLGRRND